MARIMKQGMTVSRIFKPEARFGALVKATDGGTFSGIFLYVSPDKESPANAWEKGHNVEFNSASKRTDRFNVPAGMWCQFRGAAGSNVEIHVSYLNNVDPHVYAIEGTIEGGIV